MKKDFGEYYLGLDMGTDSVGWAVTDTKYNLLTAKRKQMWGIRLFDGANTAEERRLLRGSRRRIGRRHERMNLLEEIFSSEVANVDQAFFLRMKESKYYLEDKKVAERFSLFADCNYTDAEYHKEFPTIYHLRKALVEGDKKYDIRLYFLGIHHIMKHRGHFLFEGQNMEKATSFSVVFDELVALLRDEYDMDLSCSNMEALCEIIKDRRLGITKKNSLLSAALNFTGRYDGEEDTKLDTLNVKLFIKLLAGSNVSLKDLFYDSTLEELEVNKINFSSGSYDDNIVTLQGEIPEYAFLIEKLKAIYDWGVLANIIGEEKYLSYSKVKAYEKHKYDLALLKKVIRGSEYFTQEDYKDIFVKLDEKVSNYAVYVGKTMNSGKKKPQEKLKDATQETFCKYVLSYLNRIPENERDDEVNYLIGEANNVDLMPKQVNKDNGVIPYQLHLAELQVILENLVRDYPSFGQKDETGYSGSEKLRKLFTFRIPYYVGPLNDAHANKEDYTKGNCWIAKKTEGKILPWNFDELVDKEESASRFIRRMTNKCTYLVGEDVLPKNSILYSRFMLLNELNNLCIDKEPISVELKQKLYKDVFQDQAILGKVTAKKLVKYLQQENILEVRKSTEVPYEITGIDGEFKNSLTSYHDMKKIFGTRVNTDLDMIEDIITCIVIFGEDKSILKTRLRDKYISTGRMTEDEMKLVLKKRYTGWGRLSKAFLDGIEGDEKDTGLRGTIISMMTNTNCNMMQLLSENYTYLDEIKRLNSEKQGNAERITYDLVEDLYASPSVKRMIWQSLSIVNDVIKVIGYEPKKVFVEMAREKTDDGRKSSRKDKLIESYKTMKADDRNWVEELAGMNESDFRSIKRYLYFTQMGQCMYCGKRIDLGELMTTDTYDRDHIYPQSKTKDDSLDNLVLVCKSHNSKKSDVYPLNREYQDKMRGTWKLLKDKKLISQKKYDRLVRTEPLSADELASFIARQLVETRQSTKAVASILNQVFDEKKVVYVKAGNVSEFRKGKSVKIGNTWGRENQFIKVREVNDYHHAQDAYLNIVVGNVYDTKFTRSPINFVKDAKYREYSLNRMYDFKVERGGVVAWEPGKDGTMATVKAVMEQNLARDGKIQFTRYAFEKRGGLFDQMLMKKGKGQVKIKGSDARLSIEKYGGFNKAAGAYFMLVESDGKNGMKKRTLESIPVYLAKRVEEDPQVALDYFTNGEAALVNPRIVLKKIKINSLLKINGYPMHVSGKSGRQIIMKSAVQLQLEDNSSDYFKKISKFVARSSESRNDKHPLVVSVYDEISANENIHLYEELLTKHKSSIYSKRMASQIKTLEEGKTFFENLSLEKQVFTLFEIMRIFQCKIIGADLSKIGGSKSAGVIYLSNDITKAKQAKLINQSPTGLFESEIDLLKI